MSGLGNLVWLIFGGLLAALGYFIGGVILCVTIIGIPFGLQAFGLGIATLTPFGKQVTMKPRGEGCLPLFFNVFWLVLFGWEIAVIHVVFGVILTISIIGIPFANQHFKLAQVALLPFSFRLE
jgi:uncharacterized membrane protein YccF (DUF307 family)